MANDTLSACLAEIKANCGRYYVYILARPCGAPFYVGCGAATQSRHSDRIQDHEREARGSHQSHKCSVIRKIVRSGSAVRYSIDSWHDDLNAMFAREVRLIADIGRSDKKSGPLTNQNDGGTGQFNPSKEVRAKQISSIKRAWTPEARARSSATTKSLHQKDPTLRVRQRQAQKRALEERPEIALRQSERSRQFWSDPEWRARWLEKNRAACSDPAYRAKRSEIAKRMFQDPAARERSAIAATIAWQDPKYRAAQAKRDRKAYYQTEAGKAANAKRISTLRRRYEDPAERQKRRDQWTPERRAAAAERGRQQAAARKLKKEMEQR